MAHRRGEVLQYRGGCRVTFVRGDVEGGAVPPRGERAPVRAVRRPIVCGLIHHLLQTVAHPACVTQFTHSTTAFALSAGFEKRCGLRLAKRKLSPCLSVQVSRVHRQYHLAFQHQAGLFAVVGIEFVAGVAAGLQVHEKQVEAAVRSRRTQQLLGNAGAPELQFGALHSPRHHAAGRGIRVRLGTEQRGDADAEHIGQRGEHAQRRRRQPALDLAEKADR